MALEKDDIDRLKEMFVHKDECNKTVARENEKISELAVLGAKTNTKLSILIAILGAIAVPVLTLSIKLLFGT